MSRTKWTKRIEFLSSDVLRIVCAPGDEHDRCETFAVRDASRFRKAVAKRSGAWNEVIRGAIRVRYKEDGRELDARNLEVHWENSGEIRVWRPGMLDAENLGGSYLSLDLVGGGMLSEEHRPYDPMRGFDYHNVGMHALADLVRDTVREKIGKPEDNATWWGEFCRLTSGEKPTVFRQWPKTIREKLAIMRLTPPGLLSRSGLTIFRDDSLPWDRKAQWVKPRPEVAPQVLYLVHYGDDYKAGLRNLTELLGPVPRPDDWVLGVWFSCYRRMGERHYRKLEADFRKHDLPLDAVVIDTDWHRIFWHGFDYDARLFPDPKRFTKWMRSRGLHGIYNVHPIYIPEKDSRLPEFLKKSGTDLRVYTKENAPTWFQENCHEVDLFDPEQARLYFDIFHKPIERDGGCDMWWIDGTLKEPGGRDATAWMNDLYATEARPRDPRAPRDRIVLSRTHGLGAHRSTLHFTGDTFSQWGVLAAEVRLTPLAANSLLAYVSHDIGGFFRGVPEDKKNKPADDLMVRWTQFGCMSPIMRFHSDHGVREPWRFSKSTLATIREFLQLRKSWAHYFAQLADEAHATGAGIVRPIYYEFPGHETSYASTEQYMLGSEILVSPVVRADGRVRTWLPGGRWRHLFLDRVIEGNCTIEEEVPLSIIPVYTRAEKFPHEKGYKLSR